MCYEEIKEIVEQYKNDEKLYHLLLEHYLKNDSSIDESDKLLDEIKNIIASYYLLEYKYKIYYSGEKHEQLISRLETFCDIKKSIVYKDNKIKIYPVKESDENKKSFYEQTIKEMVDYQIQTRLDIEEIFDIYEKKINDKINQYIELLKNKELNLYYGHPYYLIERSKFIAECIKYIPNTSIDVEYLINEMLSFENKYMLNRKKYFNQESFVIEDDQFYKDYDSIVSCYKKLLIIEDNLAPIVIDYWKKYLTNPNEHSERYRYLTHSFSNGIVEPSIMRKACCSLSTNEIENYMYGSCGLIYDIDVDSIETMCTTDVGSWVITKEVFVDRLCPGSWQLTNQDGESVFYEYPINSKLIMPKMFENICKELSLDTQHWNYSEIFLNKNAKAIGVFYNNECENLDEIEAYALQNNLPLVHVAAKNRKNNNSVMIG